MQVVTRFAPSPTGTLHIGSLRTAFYSWLFAKRNNGKFILRIEDTDSERCTNNFFLEIINSLKLLGLNWDKGPYLQTNKLQRYKNFIFYMLKNNLAYKCYCSKERLNLLRNYQIANNIKPKYDQKCRYNINSVKENAKFVVRFKNPVDGDVVFIDHIRGKIKFSNNELDDLIIQRSNGIPTYNFCVIIDDLDSGVTHIIRGEDHISNTPRQINILKSLQARIPNYAHLSMVLDSQGKKISKRKNASSVLYYLNKGYLQKAILNYIFRLGWASGNKEIFTLKEMINKFSLSKINKAPSIFNLDKLLWYNTYYIRNSSFNSIGNILKKKFSKCKINILSGPKLNIVFDFLKEHANTLDDIIKKSYYFYSRVNFSDCINFTKYININKYNFIYKMYKIIKNISIWSIDNISTVIKNISMIFDIHIREVIIPLRVILTGLLFSPSIYKIMYILKKKETVYRMKDAIMFLKKYNNY